jgi:hypothetical protein
VRLLVAAGTLWLLFGLGLMLNVTGHRRLMRMADGLLAVEFVGLVTTSSIDGDGAGAIMALVVAPSLAGGFLAYCAQVGLRSSRRAGR